MVFVCHVFFLMASAWDRGAVYANPVGLQPANQAFDRSGGAPSADGGNVTNNLLAVSANAAAAAFSDDDTAKMLSSMTHETLRRRLFEFLRNYVEKGGHFTYRDQLRDAATAHSSTRRFVFVNMADLRSFDPDVASVLMLAPAAVMPTVLSLLISRTLLTLYLVSM